MPERKKIKSKLYKCKFCGLNYKEKNGEIDVTLGARNIKAVI